MAIRAIQKPKSIPDMRNFLPRRLLTCKMVICEAAPRIKSKRKTAHIGSSRVVVGRPPIPAVVGGYGLWFDIGYIGLAFERIMKHLFDTDLAYR